MRRFIYGASFLLCIFGQVDAAWAQPGNAQFAMGRAAMQKNDFDSAIPAFESAVKADENNPVYHYWLGNAYGGKATTSNMFVKMRYASRIRSEWERAVALDPDYYEARANLYEFYTQAPAVAGGSADKARAQRDAMFRLRPYAAALQFANVGMQSKKYDAVVASLTPLLKQYPDSVAVPVALAAAQVDAKRYADAWGIIDAAAQRFASAPELEYATGRTAALSGSRLAEGAAALTRYLAAPPSAANKTFILGAHYRLGMILERQRDSAGARREYQAALAIDPKYAPARTALDHLAS